QAIRSTSFGTKILGVRKDLLAALPIPRPGSATKARVANLIRKCVQERERYLAELQAARKVVEDLPEMQQAHEMCAGRRARAVAWRGGLTTLSACNPAWAAEAKAHLMSKWSTRLGDVVPDGGVFTGPRFAPTPCQSPHGIDFC